MPSPRIMPYENSERFAKIAKAEENKTLKERIADLEKQVKELENELEEST